MYILYAFLLSSLITVSFTPLAIIIAKKYKLLDNPKTRYHPARTHIGTIPRAGGLSICFGLLLTMLVFLPWNMITMSLIVACIILTIVGLIDDKKDVSPKIRLFTNAFVVFLVLAAGVSIPYITNPFNEGVIFLNTWTITIGMFTLSPIAFIAAFIWLYWTMNVVGWSAGVDGQLPGVVVIAATVLGILSLRYSAIDASQIHVTILSAIVAGSFLGFLPWNFYPQKIMPGYSGKTLAGFFLGILGILSYAKLGTALLVLGIPMIDALFTLSRRLLLGKSPIWADRGHLHHHLLNLGWSKRTIALFYYCISAILGLVALTVSSKEKIVFFLILAFVLGAFLIWVNWAWQSLKQPDQDNG